jgi:hypothetical protein
MACFVAEHSREFSVIFDKSQHSGVDTDLPSGRAEGINLVGLEHSEFPFEVGSAGRLCLG